MVETSFTTRDGYLSYLSDSRLLIFKFCTLGKPRAFVKKKLTNSSHINIAQMYNRHSFVELLYNIMILLPYSDKNLVNHPTIS